MIIITDNRIAALQPVWARFPGFSLLFDNTDASLSPVGKFLKINVVPTPDEALSLYAALDRMLDELGRDYLLQAYLFCSLPINCYHVTVWDGINVGNISSVWTGVRAEWAEFLERLPDSLETPPKSMNIILQSDLAKILSGRVSLRFEKLSIRGNRVLALLGPADEASGKQLRVLCEARRRLSKVVEVELGVRSSRSYSPHISLGYFANKEHAQLAHACLEDWTDRFQNDVAASVVTYRSLDVYGFTDMTSIFKENNRG